MLNKKTLLAIFVLLSLSNLQAQNPEFALPAIISDHAVMQRDVKVKLWGWCPSLWDLKIVCSWASSDTIRAKSNAFCEWEADVKTTTHRGPHTIRFYGWNNELVREVSDIVMGETWLCSGQSNMEYIMEYPILDAGDISGMISNNEIRFFKVTKASSRYPVERMQGSWEVCSPETYKNFSAVGFFFGQQLNKALNTPIGLIGSYWGGTSIETWMPKEAFESGEELLKVSQRLRSLEWTPTANSIIYNAMIHPIKNYTIAGTIWYQGEANNERAKDYSLLMKAMINSWRAAFNQKMPFHFVQIAPWNGYANRNAAYLREQQQEVVTSLPDVGMVVIADLVNDISDIHPSLKRQVAERLANMALRMTYNKNEIDPYAPTITLVEVRKNNIIVKTTASRNLICKGKRIENFELLDAMDNIYSAEAKLLSNGDIEVSSNKLKSPVAVRYCFTNEAVPNLFNNNNGLPLAPFRTDRIK